MKQRGGNFDSLSVIIATKDRARELETISLPSLARQDTRDFEVIVWDASKDDRSEERLLAVTAMGNSSLRGRPAEGIQRSNPAVA